MPRQAGFSYLIVMFLVAVLGIASTRALEHSLTAERRAKEEDLLWMGLAYREAIRQYYEGASGSFKSYPPTLSDLLEDTRLLTRPRLLRKLYRDPVSGDKGWGKVTNKEGEVIGVYSLAPGRPIKRAGFPPELANFTNAQSYSEWKFIYQPKGGTP